MGGHGGHRGVVRNQPRPGRLLLHGNTAWLQPIPDTLITPQSEDPAAIVAAHESLRLALIASLQYLPPRQRAVFILREVLAFPAAEVATMLDTSTAAIKSSLQRARARLDEVAPTREKVSEPTEPHTRALLDQYIAGFENADTAALEQALRTDAADDLMATTHQVCPYSNATRGNIQVTLEATV
jgi:RNA polymerase sigma-70 factor (ECF subfamily)